MTDFSGSYWKGKPFDDLDRSELLEVIVHLAAEAAMQKQCYEAELNKLRGTIFSMQLTDKLFKHETVN